MDHFSLSSSGNGDKFLNSSVHFPAEMRYKKKETHSFEYQNQLSSFRSANLNEMVSNIVDENSEFYQNNMMPSFSQYQSASTWSNGGQLDQHMQYMQQVKK
jgi:hypothetical protein